MTPIVRPPCPPQLEEQLRLATSIFLSTPNEDRSIARLVRPRMMTELRRTLAEVFENRCCYCETELGSATPGEIERFRPHAGVASSDGKFTKDQYAHLAFEWRNLYLCCPNCNRAKAARFPLDGPPAPPEAPYDVVVQIEHPMLLDPCRDNPDDHLVFDADGTVAGLTARGAATIETLRLNRAPLVKARREEAYFAVAMPAGRGSLAARRHPAVWRQLAEARVAPEQAKQRADVAHDVQASLEERRSHVSTERGEGLENYRARSSYVEKIVIHNVGPITRLELTPEDSQATRAPCFALLGNNGVGKSTVLKAIALAMSGASYARRLRISSNRLLGATAHTGEVRIKTGDGREDMVMSLRRGRHIQFNYDSSRALVVAYGATRLLPRGRHKPKAGLRHAKIDNLFNPFLPLADAAAWLEARNLERLEEANRVLAALLPDGQDMRLTVAGPQGALRVLLGNDAPRSIYELSDGYQSMLAMAVDIMEVMDAAGFESMQAAQGIVLVDEMGNHFHPSWRLRALSALRTAFPAVQFIYSTHDPLCLRGLVQGEVAVLRRDRMGQVYALADLPAVDRLRVEQLLTSEHFGLQSTVDPELQDAMERYESLVQRPDRSADEEQELLSLTQLLTDERYLGTTRRERMLVQLLQMEDVEAAVPRDGGAVSAAKLSEATLAKLRLVLRTVTPVQDGSQ